MLLKISDVFLAIFFLMSVWNNGDRNSKLMGGGGFLGLLRSCLLGVRFLPCSQLIFSFIS